MIPHFKKCFSAEVFGPESQLGTTKGIDTLADKWLTQWWARWTEGEAIRIKTGKELEAASGQLKGTRWVKRFWIKGGDGEKAPAE